ncbi:hypothetical protein AK830_g12194 [Neonectria ditissima]|uniref:Mitochondrial genome maintenance protein MGM101 n=1 Tax=Neonectria ditissima TaxID=78410 RepID=A0A0P7B0Y8_9HYPO|nr:hypothetical protein AK830_g12194 [Neonectria ditissima]
MLASRRAFAATPGSCGRSIASVLRYSTEAAARTTAPPAFKAAAPPPVMPATTSKTAAAAKASFKPSVTFKPAYVAKKILTTPPSPAESTSKAPEPTSSPPVSEASSKPKSTAPSKEKAGYKDMPPSLYWEPSPPPQGPKLQPPHPDINWETSFYGLGTSPVTPEQYSILLQKINVYDIEVKPDGIIYLPEIKYRRRLNEAFGPMGWGIVPRGEAVVGKDIVTREFALIANGCFVSQAQGVNNYFTAESIPQAVEGAKSNALMRCCKDLGIASELWDPLFIRWYTKVHAVSAWVEHTGTKKKRRWHFRKDMPLEVPYPYKLS